MGDARGRDGAGAFQFDGLDAQMLEQTDALTQQHRHEIDADFIQQPGLEALPRDIRPADADAFSPASVLACSTACARPPSRR